VTTDNDGVKRRALIALVGLPAGVLLLLTIATQFIAWRLDYDSILGPPVLAHVYWPWRVIQWWFAPWETVYDQTFTLAKFGVGGLVGMCLMGFVRSTGRKPVKQVDLYGNAHFLDEKEIQSTGLLPDKRNRKPGIIVGGWTNKHGGLRYLIHTGVDHVLCLGPTRSGKTASILLPTLLTWPFSMIVYDPKGELWQRSGGWRRAEASNIVMRFAPTEVDNTIQWNPFDRVRINTPYEYRDISNIIEQVADPKGKGMSDHWEPTAGNFMVGVALHCFRVKGKCSLSAILDMVDDPKEQATELLKDMAESVHKQVAQVGQGMMHTPDRERGSIISTARRLLRLYRDPVVARNTERSSFSIDQLMNS
jgi:type IV secretion system protein VirD4